MYAADKDNPWLRDVPVSPSRWRAGAVALVASVFAITVLFTFRAAAAGLQQAIAAALKSLPGMWPDVLTSGALQCLIFGLFLGAAMVGTGLERRRPWRGEPGGPVSLAMGLIIGAVGFGAAVAIAAVAGAVTSGPPPAIPSPVGGLLFGLGVVAVQSVAEEAFFRGWVQPVLCADWGPWVGLIVTSALFGGLHIIAGAHGPVAVLNLFLGGVLFGLLALRTGNLWAAAGAHFAWNWTESGFLGLAYDPSGSVLNLSLTGTPLWNGGEDTMNGSLATTIVLIALVGATSLWKTNRQPTRT